jgi:ABC-type glycerol-3-phosphate transport system permease component
MSLTATVTTRRARVAAHPQERVGGLTGRLVSVVLLILLGVIFAFPILWAALNSLKSTNDIITGTYPLSLSSFVPLKPTIENYLYVFGELQFQHNLLNTLIAAAGQVGIAVVASSLAGYAFARLKFAGRDLLFGLLLLTAFIPVEAIIVPLYRIMQTLGLVSTYPALFLPFACNPFGIYLMRQAFRDIPTEMDEAARIDGAGPLRVFFSIALPNVKPTLATLVLIQFIWSWNAYLWPLIVMQDPNKQIAQVAIANLKSIPNSPMDGPLFAAATAVTLPLVVLSILLQRYYVRGLVTSGMK